MPLERMVVLAVIEWGLGPPVSKAINSDFLSGDTGTVGLEDEVAGIENPTTEDVGRVLRVVGPEDGDAGDEAVEEVEGRRRSAHDFLTAAGASGAGDEAAESGVESVVAARPSWLMTVDEDTEEPETAVKLEVAVGVADIDKDTREGADDDGSRSDSALAVSSITV